MCAILHVSKIIYKLLCQNYFNDSGVLIKNRNI